MSWIDRTSIENVLKLRDLYEISTYVETGTHFGINARFHAKNFHEVLTCEINHEYISKAKEKLGEIENVEIVNQSSPEFLKGFVEKYRSKGREDAIFFYLDAHFWSEELKGKSGREKWIALRELDALKGFHNSVLMIHDFDNGLGHLCYEGEHFNFSLLKDGLYNVNPEFYFYTNYLDGGCEIYTPERFVAESGMIVDHDTMDNVFFVNSKPRQSFRGILYCTPTQLDLSNFNLREWGEIVRLKSFNN